MGAYLCMGYVALICLLLFSPEINVRAHDVGCVSTNSVRFHDLFAHGSLDSVIYVCIDSLCMCP